MLKKSEVPVPPQSREQIVPVPELGGDVLVRGLMLKDRLMLTRSDGYGVLSTMLSTCVFVEGEQGAMVQLYTEQEWERWGAIGRNYNAAMMLWDLARSLSDIGGVEATKNSEAQNSELPVD